MKQRNPIVVFILSIITLGIYDIYWLVSTKKELNAKTSHRVPSIWWLFSPIALLIVGIILVAVAASGAYSNASNFGNGSYQTCQGSNPGGFYTSNSQVAPSCGSSADVSSTYGSTNSPTGSLVGMILIVIGAIATFFISAYWFFKYSKAVDEYTSGKMSTAVSFLTLWLVHLIGVALIQDAYNDMNGGVPSSTVTPPPSPSTPPPSNAPTPSVLGPPTSQTATAPPAEQPLTPPQTEQDNPPPPPQSF